VDQDWTDNFLKICGSGWTWTEKLRSLLITAAH